MTAHSIAGGWRGNYQHKGLPEGCPDLGGDWTASISENSGQIEGTIVDDDPAHEKGFT